MDANPINVVVSFDNAAADFITLRADFTLNGNQECAEKQIALVQVTVGPATFGNPGRPTAGATQNVFLVNPPAPPNARAWVTAFHPGSAWASFTYNGTKQAAEPGQRINSDGALAGGAFTLTARVTLTSPAGRPQAHQHIQVGFIQGDSDAGLAIYATAPPPGIRNVAVPTPTVVDWLSSINGPTATDDWPWYDQSVRATGAGPSPWSQVLSMTDSPSLSFPAQLDPNHPAAAGSAAALIAGAATLNWSIRVGARTLDQDLKANEHYFDESHSTWTASFVWPLPAPAVSLVTLGPAWTAPGAPTEILVDVVPSVINGNAPFFRFE